MVGKTPFPEMEAKFREMGFDRGFPRPTSDLAEAAALLRKDVDERSRRER